jgi:hypothetical protein
MELTDSELGFLVAHDTDPFNKWEASQKLGVSVLKKVGELKRDQGVVVKMDEVHR